ncbi:MAG: beta-mannosidase, partial [Prevotella sp.]|nr:beta-mannosidase [Prevotella sp.]
VAKEHGLIPALTETGMKNLTQPDWWSTTLLPAIEEYPISYVLTWRNYKGEWFGPSTSKPDAPYFVEFYNSDKTMFLKEITE